MVSLNNADVVLSGVRVLHDLSWCIQKGRHWRVDGPNGAGKTTLLKLIAGLIWPVAKSPHSRLYSFNGSASHLLVGVKQHIGFASYAMQDEYVRRMRKLSCHEVIASGFTQNIMLYDDISELQKRAVNRICERMGLDNSLLTLPFLSASHGQKSAILFARAMIHQPRLMILDEIFNGVDAHRFDIMIELLQEFQCRGGQVVLSWHEHGVEEVEALFTDTLRLERGKIIGMEKSVRSSAGTAKSIIPDTSAGVGQLQANQPLIKLKNVNVYLANKRVLSNINWTLARGQRWLIKGENGAGKTTLLRTLLAEIRPSVDSQIWRSGLSKRASVWEIRKLIGYVSPELQQLYQYNVSVTDAVASGFFSSIGLYDKVSSRQQARVEKLLLRFDLLNLAEKGVHQISSGQMRRVLIARAMVRDPEIMIFDEITANLDTRSRQKILSMIKNQSGPENAMILVSHHHSEFAGIYNRVLEIKSGKIAAMSK